MNAIVAACDGNGDDLCRQFNDFKVKFNKQYSSAEEESFRFNVFKDNIKEAAQIQAEQPLATFGITKFSDLTHEEFTHRYLGLNTRLSNKRDAPADQAPKLVDRGLMGDYKSPYDTNVVEYQDSCGSFFLSNQTFSPTTKNIQTKPDSHTSQPSQGHAGHMQHRQWLRVLI